MSAAPALPIGVAKELRALIPLWGACAAAIGAAAVMRDTRVVLAAMVAFTLGSIALGAQSIGHEYTHRTLGLLLAQPRDRRRLLLAKLAVLAPMLVTLAVPAWWVLFRERTFLPATAWGDFAGPLLIAACGLFLAPWLTMLSRSAMAGIVFTVSIPPMLLIGGDIAGTIRYGLDAAATVDRFKFALLLWGTLSACAIAAVAGWRTFMRLEAIDGAGLELHLPRWSVRPTRSKPRHRVVLLIRKELRLQQLTFTLVALYAAFGLTVWLGRQENGIWSGTLVPGTMVYIMLLAVLIGSLASAEERQLGTRDVQLLLPMAAWKQWAVKSAVALVLALALGFALPVFLDILTEGRVASLSGIGWWVVGVAIVLLTSSSLYISSLSSSGVRAVVMSVAALVAFVAFIQALAWALSTVLYSDLAQRMAGALPLALRDGRMQGLFMDIVPPAMAPTLATLLLWFAFVNHRTAERRTRHVVLQLLWIALVPIVGQTLLMFAAAVLRIR